MTKTADCATTGWAKKVSLFIVAIFLSTANQLSQLLAHACTVWEICNCWIYILLNTRVA